MYNIREGSALLCRSTQEWTGYPLRNGEMNFEPTGTPGGVLEVIHWGSREIPIPTPGQKILSAACANGPPSLKGTLTRTTCITCHACGISHVKQKGNQPRRSAPPQCVAATNSATEFPFACHSCKVSFLNKEAPITHTRGVHKITSAFLNIQAVANDAVDEKEKEKEKSTVQSNRHTQALTYKQAATNPTVQKLSADARKAITGQAGPGELDSIAEDRAGEQNPAAKPPPKHSFLEERRNAIAQGKNPVKEKRTTPKKHSSEPGEKPDPTSSAKKTPQPPPSTTVEATQGTVTTRSTTLATRPAPTLQGQGAPCEEQVL